MAKPRKDGVVDSYAAIKAAGRAAKSRPAVAAAVTAATSDELQKLGAQVRQGAVPTKQLVECYECGYRFQLHGRVAKTNCNKCRAVLDLTDHIVDQRWTGTIKTGGLVRALANGIVDGGTVIAH